MLLNPYQSLDDINLEHSLLVLAQAERQANADIILHLLVVKERKLYVPKGYDSLFAYCTGQLGFSRSTAYRRKAVVDKATTFPALIDRLRDGRLQLCAAAAIAPHLENDAAEELLDAVCGLSHREVEVLLVKHWRAKTPAPAKSPTPPIVATSEPGLHLDHADTAQASPLTAQESQKPQTPPSAPFVSRTVIRPLSPETNRVSVTLSDKTLDNLRRAKELLGAKSDDEILFRALEKLLDQHAPERRHARRQKNQAQKAEKTKSSQERVATTPETLAPASRRGRLADRDNVMVEGECRCTFTAEDGKRCNARVFLEIDHIQPWALGGPSILENERPLCRTHNAFCAEQVFGRWSPENRVN